MRMMGNLNGLYLTYAIITILVSLTIHEFMHAYAGYKLGDTTAKNEGRLTLNPLSHIDPVMTVALPIITLLAFGGPILAAKPVPFNPGNVKFEEFGGAIIAAAGPLSNLLLAIIGSLMFNYLNLGVGFAGDFLKVFVPLNVMLFVFNMIPIPPLDGSRVLYAFAPESLQEFIMRIEPFGFIIVFGLVFLVGGGDIIMNVNNFILDHLSSL